MQVHCTKKLMAKLPQNHKINSAEPVAELPQQLPANVVLFPGTKLKNQQEKTKDLGQWHANLVVIQRRRCIMFVHDITRFGLIIPCVQKVDFANLDNLFIDIFINTLLKLDYPFAVVDAASQLLTPFKYDSHCNRSVQGTMRVMISQIEHLVWVDNIKVSELNPCSTSAWVNEMPCTVKGQKEVIWPIKAMKEFIQAKM
ncbi:DUF6933 domain-containing protein [Catenovulum adriaticum]|uniref:DUF6933 domain-containing protein n=1 Tax=Catenovulum adriaticum TaxID=2984846 RepID=A0ABY7ALV8_9ALTE|nr:hypothetical protein [Catenovulum sp. TS8]WAJ70232.1 hypothetical protein OLW01_13975 [Catenovulum sp. TS8]